MNKVVIELARKTLDDSQLRELVGHLRHSPIAAEVYIENLCSELFTQRCSDIPIRFQKLINELSMMRINGERKDKAVLQQIE